MHNVSYPADAGDVVMNSRLNSVLFALAPITAFIILHADINFPKLKA